MTINPIGNRLVVKLVNIESTTKSGLILSSNAEQKELTAKILAVGPDVNNCLQTGQQILIGKYVGTEVEIGGEKQLIINEKDVLAVLE